jgi:hypothetical protein
MRIDELAAFLEGKARDQRTVFYSDLVARFGLPPLGEHWNLHPLAQAFDILDREDAAANRPFRTSVVIAKENNMPGGGYFTSLATLKNIHVRTEARKLEVFTQQLSAAFEYPW